MSISQKFKRAASWGVLIGAWAGAVVQAAEFPDKPVTIVVPYAAGGFTDQVARAIAPVLAEKWGKPVVIDNRPGGGTTIGTAFCQDIVRINGECMETDIRARSSCDCGLANMSLLGSEENEDRLHS